MNEESENIMNEPPDPVGGELSSAAIILAEFYDSLVSAGFDDEQALRLTTAWMLDRTTHE